MTTSRISPMTFGTILLWLGLAGCGTKVSQSGGPETIMPTSVNQGQEFPTQIPGNASPNANPNIVQEPEIVQLPDEGVEHPTLLANLSSPPYGFSFAVFHKDHNELLLGFRQTNVFKIRNISSGTDTGHFTTNPEMVSKIDLNRDQTSAAIQMTNLSVEIWDLKKKERKTILSGHVENGSVIAFSPDGQMLATGGKMGQPIRVWDVATGKAILDLAGEHEMIVTRLLFSRNGTELISGDFDGIVVVWDLKNGKAKRAFDIRSQGLKCLTWIGDGSMIAAGGYDGKLKMIDIESEEEVGSAPAHKECVYSIASTEDGRLLATGGADQVTILWKTEGLVKLKVLGGLGEVTYQVQFTPDGSRLIVCGGSGAHSVQVWQIPVERLLWAPSKN